MTVNGEVAGLATFVEGGDSVALDGERVAPEPLTYVLLNKPAGVVTTARDPHGRPTVVGLVGHERRIVPVGRLDADTTGVLLLTNDGPLAHRLMHPRYEVDKVYEVEVEGEPSDEALGRLRRGVELEDGITAPAEARRLGANPLVLEKLERPGGSMRLSSGVIWRWNMRTKRSCNCAPPQESLLASQVTGRRPADPATGRASQVR